MEIHFHTTVRTLRSDNGTEFRSIAFEDLLRRYGIAHQRTCVYTPQQLLQLLQLARALLFQAHLSKYFWDHDILMSTYLINRLPSSLLAWKSPYDILYKRHLDCSPYDALDVSVLPQIPNHTKISLHPGL